MASAETKRFWKQLGGDALKAGIVISVVILGALAEQAAQQPTIPTSRKTTPSEPEQVGSAQVYPEGYTPPTGTTVVDSSATRR